MPPLFVPFWRNSPEMPAVETAHDLSPANPPGNETPRFLVRPYLPVGLDRLPLDRRGAARRGGRQALGRRPAAGRHGRLLRAEALPDQGAHLRLTPQPARPGSGPLASGTLAVCAYTWALTTRASS